MTHPRKMTANEYNLRFHEKTPKTKTVKCPFYYFFVKSLAVVTYSSFLTVFEYQYRVTNKIELREQYVTFVPYFPPVKKRAGQEKKRLKSDEVASKTRTTSTFY